MGPAILGDMQETDPSVLLVDPFLPVPFGANILVCNSCLLEYA